MAYKAKSNTQPDFDLTAVLLLLCLLRAFWCSAPVWRQRQLMSNLAELGLEL